MILLLWPGLLYLGSGEIDSCRKTEDKKLEKEILYTCILQQKYIDCIICSNITTQNKKKTLKKSIKNHEENYSWRLTLREGLLRVKSKENSITLGSATTNNFL